MKHPAALSLLFALATACASTPRPAARPAPRHAPATFPPVSAPVAQPVAPAPPAPIEVRAPPANPLAFDITASSDLPPQPASTAQPYARIVDAAVAPLRPALAECLRPLGAPARHVVRITVDEEGALHPRPPQEFVLSARDARCLDGVLRAATVEPAPPRALPYDLRVDVAQ